MRRTFAVISKNPECDANVGKMVPLLKSVPESDVVVFTAGKQVDGVENVSIPSELNTEPKIRNWINRRFDEACFSGFLHVISDTTELLKDPAPFVADIERMMAVTDYSLWFNTACDPLNYAYAKYTPSLTIEADHPDIAEKTGIIGNIHVASHSNTQWVAYDFSKLAGSDLLRFDEDFSVPMFYIVELLARRRNTARKDQLYAMNQYLTVGSEPGTFRILRIDIGRKETEDDVKRENELWQSKKINFRPDYNVDALLEKLWEKLAEKSGVPSIL